MPESTLLIAVAVAFLWGLRHGVDWDHIAAITDIASVQDDRHQSITLGGYYILGHALVVGVLAIGAILVGAKVPVWLDSSMGTLVGLTLVALGVYVIASVVRARDGQGQVRLRSKWGLIFDGASMSYERIRAAVTGGPVRPHKRFFNEYTSTNCVGVGMIHGIGAETPSQLILFSAAAGIAGSGSAFILLLAFIAGMLITNGAMVLMASFGLSGIDKTKGRFLGIAAFVGVLSIGVGVMAIAGYGELLPAIIADPAIAGTE